MGFFSRLLGRKPAKAEAWRKITPEPKEAPHTPPTKPDDITSVWITGNGQFQVEIAGESHYQDALEQIAGGRTEDGADKQLDATLTLEDDNPYDPNAVRVDLEGQTVGYLPRSIAPQFRQKIAHLVPWGVPFRCRAWIRGGWDRGEDDRGHFGVRLDFSDS